MQASVEYVSLNRHSPAEMANIGLTVNNRRLRWRWPRYLFTCTTHSFQHYSYASANYVDYVSYASLPIHIMFLTRDVPAFCSPAFSTPCEFGPAFSIPAFSVAPLGGFGIDEATGRNG